MQKAMRHAILVTAFLLPCPPAVLLLLATDAVPPKGAPVIKEEPVLSPTTAFADDPSIGFSTNNPGGLPLCRASVNGTEGWFIIDTGASISAVSSHFADEVGLKDRTHLADAQINGQGSGVNLASVGELRIGGNRFSGFNMVLLDFSHLDGMLKRKVAGIIGLNVLLQAPFTMDFTNGRATWNAPAAPEATTVTAHLLDDLLRVRLTLDETPLWLYLDTGASINAVHESEWKGDRRVVAHGVRQGTATETSNSSLVSAVYKDLKIESAPQPRLEFIISNTHSCLGAPFFKGRTVRFEMPKASRQGSFSFWFSPERTPAPQ